MFNLFRRIFGNDRAATVVSEPNASAAPAPKAAAPVENRAGGMEVASLSLRAILAKLPPELAAIVNQLPDSEAKIVLPVNTIMKQLAGGSVKMSLASLLRQAPSGTFRKTEVEDKRLIEVPLAEIFKTINPARLQRRADQRQYDVPENATGLFGHNGQIRSVASPAAPPTAKATSEPAMPAPDSAQSAAHAAPNAVPRVKEPKVEPAKVLRMPGIPTGPVPTPASGNGNPVVPTPKVISSPRFEGSAEPSRLDLKGELTLSCVVLASAWHEGVRSELSILSGDTKVVVPVSAVGPGLQKGRVAFPWSQVRLWFRPPVTSRVSIPDDLELIFPLRMVAPAFVAATGATKLREGAVVDQTLPDFFGPAASKTTKSEVPHSAQAEAPVASVEPPVATGSPAGESKLPVTGEMPVAHGTAGQFAVTTLTPIPEPAAEIAPAPTTGLKLSAADENTASAEAATPVAVAAPSPVPQREPSTLCELFNQPGKSAWSPAELVAHTCGLPGVAGAVIALEEGLVVAQQLPDGFTAETFAAFMPQFFGRLETYSHEMKLGDTNEITIQSTNAPCHLVRHGKVFFATLGCLGEKLPAGLKLIPTELAAHIR